jgi:hypothetical protein
MFSRAFQCNILGAEKQVGVCSITEKKYAVIPSVIREGFYHGTCRTMPLYAVHDSALLFFAELTPKVEFDFRQNHHRPM